MRSISRLAVLLLVSGMLAVAGPPVSQSSAQATSSLKVTPSTALVGGDVVTLNGTGFAASTEVFYCQAVVAGTPDQSDCGTAFQTASTDATGAFTAPFTVFRFITPTNGLGTIDCAQPAAQCVIGATTLSASPTVTPIAFTTQPPATFTVTGSLTGPGGQPLVNADVWAYTPSDSFVGSFQTVTDASGAYELHITTPNFTIRFGPPAGTDLVAEWFADTQHRNSAVPLFSGAFNDGTTFDLGPQQLEEGGAIAGVVTDTAGVGLSGVTVWAYGPGDRWVGSFGTTTSANGSYRIDGVRPMLLAGVPVEYVVRFMPASTSGLAIEWYDNAALRAVATSVTVTRGSTTAGINAQLSPTS